MAITVITPAASKDLTVLTTVKAELEVTGTTDDTFLGTLIQQASAAIVSYCGREFAAEEVDETVKAYGTATLMISRTPVTALSTVTLDDGISSVTVPRTDYALEDAENGFIRSLVGPWKWTATQGTGILARPVAGSEFQAYKVRYTGGYTLLTTLPHDVERACIDLVKVKYLARGQAGNITEQEVPGVYRAEYAPGDVTPAIRSLLAPWRRIA